MENVSGVILGRAKDGTFFVSTVYDVKSIQATINSIYADHDLEYKVLTSNDKFPRLLSRYGEAHKLIEGFSKKPNLDGCFIINYAKAKEIWKERMRKFRDKIMPELDVQYMRSIEAGDTQKQLEISERKMKLRNITNTELPDDLQVIDSTWPSVLGSRPEEDIITPLS